MEIQQKDIAEIENGLDSFSSTVRKNNLLTLMDMVDDGTVSLPPQRELANLHCHTFFSYNGYGFSPTHIAWLGRKLGAKFMGIVDFDVLDGVDEFLDACQITQIGGSAGMETRVFIPEYASMEINSPGEPGVCYHMGIGFTTSIAPVQAAELLENLRNQASQRNRDMLNKINQFLSPLNLDYNQDILPRTPNRNATERHMLDQIIESSFTEINDPALYWSEKLDIPAHDLSDLIQHKEAFSALVRKKLMKRGGVGYAQPSSKTFPSIDELNRIIIACGALPCFTWLDGTSQAEQDIDKLLDLMIEKGIAAVNIIPDRNWNIKDTALKTEKLNNLYQLISAAQIRSLPIIIGTEMNSLGQKWIDEIDVPELDPVRKTFLDGAYFIYGHTQMQRLWGLGWQSDWAFHNFPDKGTRNDFYQEVGRIFKPEMDAAQFSGLISGQMDPEAILQTISKPKE